jgi:hypothetical protein
VEFVQHCVHTYKGVREGAVNAVNHICKRYPCLSVFCLPFALAALSNRPLPPAEAMLAMLQRGANADGELA